MTTLRGKTLAYLRGGHVRIAAALTCPGDARPRFVEAFVASTNPAATGLSYRVRLDAGRWECSCTGDACAHLAAVQLVTGHPSQVTPNAATAGAR
ncbi:hypothetical protein [Spongiactinospora sp. TRM90649]|uniref:hypothetical protein n=1 Tax=Spongiactinospora sp. TRM90649 TaxID=3031114 RepID=UPI0023FA327D|nr:hypothetical protein [Spongiactinospora sp. TRM90649]MDF5758564.1 hypothetical protein [Spongiactinospora sp. TRM90649]